MKVPGSSAVPHTVLLLAHNFCCSNCALSFAIAEPFSVEEKLLWFLWVTVSHPDERKHGLETSQKSCYWKAVFPRMINNGKITAERFTAETHPHWYPWTSEFQQNSAETKQRNCSQVLLKNEFEKPRVTSERNYIHRAEIADSSFWEPRWILKNITLFAGFLN